LLKLPQTGLREKVCDLFTDLLIGHGITAGFIIEKVTILKGGISLKSTMIKSLLFKVPQW